MLPPESTDLRAGAGTEGSEAAGLGETSAGVRPSNPAGPGTILFSFVKNTLFLLWSSCRFIGTLPGWCTQLPHSLPPFPPSVTVSHLHPNTVWQLRRDPRVNTLDCLLIQILFLFWNPMWNQVTFSSLFFSFFVSLTPSLCVCVCMCVHLPVLPPCGWDRETEVGEGDRQVGARVPCIGDKSL